MLDQSMYDFQEKIGTRPQPGSEARKRIEAAGRRFQEEQRQKRQAMVVKTVKANVRAWEKAQEANEPVETDLDRWMKERPPFYSKPDTILRQVAVKHGVSILELKSARRSRKVATARFEAFWRMRNETVLSMPAIGKILNKDHTTVLHGIRRHAQINGLDEIAQEDFGDV